MFVSCQAKRAVLFAENLIGEILAPVPHRHWTFSIPHANQTAAGLTCVPPHG